MGLGQCIMAAAYQMTGLPADNRPTEQPLLDFTGRPGKNMLHLLCECPHIGNSYELAPTQDEALIGTA